MTGGFSSQKASITELCFVLLVWASLWTNTRVKESWSSCDGTMMPTGTTPPYIHSLPIPFLPSDAPHRANGYAYCFPYLINLAIPGPVCSVYKHTNLVTVCASQLSRCLVYISYRNNHTYCNRRLHSWEGKSNYVNGAGVFLYSNGCVMYCLEKKEHITFCSFACQTMDNLSYIFNTIPADVLWPLLLIWFNFNLSMDK